ncbi:MAG: hypothetical protein BJ554DRAFT_6898 [Olpidium bornovanus]|uniref:PSP1 C-terminal domain-containing protein n=1 Tax=Olpidium bornovanus TaxID=278681 RepID=A0A8H7ZXU9_9FUNG|nr:MAG: hypothetical protein BJ554DRAFT_6898 [Olpidium bornovanus]
MQEEERRTGKDAAAAAAAAAPGNSRSRAPPSAQRRGPGPRAGRRPESASAPAAGRRPRGAVESSPRSFRPPAHPHPYFSGGVTCADEADEVEASSARPGRASADIRLLFLFLFPLFAPRRFLQTSPPPRAAAHLPEFRPARSLQREISLASFAAAVAHAATVRAPDAGAVSPGARRPERRPVPRKEGCSGAAGLSRGRRFRAPCAGGPRFLPPAAFADVAVQVGVVSRARRRRLRSGAVEFRAPPARGRRPAPDNAGRIAGPFAARRKLRPAGVRRRRPPPVPEAEGASPTTSRTAGTPPPTWACALTGPASGTAAASAAAPRRSSKDRPPAAARLLPGSPSIRRHTRPATSPRTTAAPRPRFPSGRRSVRAVSSSSPGSSRVPPSSDQHPPGAPYGRRSSAVLAEGPDLTRMDGIPPQFGVRGLPSMSEESELCTGGALPSDHTSFTLPRLRLRSKSSAAAYGIGPPGVMNDRRFSLGAPGYDRDGLDAGVAPLASDVYGSNDEQLQEGSRRRSVTNPADYWLHAHDGEGDLAGQSAAGEPFERVRPRRRLSLHPSFTGYGGASAYQAGGFGSVAAGGELGGAGQYGDYSHLESSQGMGTLNRFLTPVVGSLARRMVEPEFGHHNQRRHSVSGPTLSFANPSQARYLGDVMESLRIDDANLYGRQPQGMIPMPPDSSRDNYADDDESRAAAAASPAIPNTVPSPVRSSPKELHPGPAATAASSDSVMHLGKGIPLHAVPHAGPLYIVEFKAGRSDLFYLVPEAGDLKIKRGDLVIVEADRGKDLGKVVSDNITPVQVQMLQQQQAEAAAVAEMGMVNKDPKTPAAAAAQQPQPQQQLQVKDLHPKRLYRLAQPAEVTMLVAKSQDETKSMLVCQAKVRQKNLPMAVVDAEYQW